MGGDLGGTAGDCPPNFEVGTAHAYVPQYFGNILYHQAPRVCRSASQWAKHVPRIKMTKKGHQEFWLIVFGLPKPKAKSPPMSLF